MIPYAVLRVRRMMRDDCFESIIPLCYTEISKWKNDADAQYRKGRVIKNGKKSME